MEMIQYKHGGKTWAEVTLWIVCQDVTGFRWRTSAFVVHSLGKQRDEERDNKPPQLCKCCRGGCCPTLEPQTGRNLPTIQPHMRIHTYSSYRPPQLELLFIVSELMYSI